MNASERYQREHELFSQARKLAPEDRDRFLTDECGSDLTLRAQVVNLIEQDDAPEAGLGPTVPVAMRDLAAQARYTPLESIAGYEIIRTLGHGAQGAVYQAVQKSTKRLVAIKVLLEGPHAPPSSRRRFEREIDLVSQLKHPNIVTIFDSGTYTPSPFLGEGRGEGRAPSPFQGEGRGEGIPWLAMDYVRGLPLRDFVRENKLALEPTLQLFMQVCDAVQYAHQKGVIHRDLKPSNIVVDSDGQPRVLDFGLAKQLSAAPEPLLSVSGFGVGTPAYMSPEQARGNPDHIDTRTDVYALGVILYELLTGTYPYPVGGALDDILRNIKETPPTPPSRAWSSDSGVTLRSDRRVRPGACPIDGELATITLKALAKERERRYQTGGDLRRDIEQYLAGEAIEAKRDSGWYVVKKALRRHQVAVVVAVAFVLLITGSAVALSILYGSQARALRAAELAQISERHERERAENALAREEEQRKLADQRAEEVRQVADFQSKMLAEIDVDAMGRGITERFREQVRAALERQAVGDSLQAGEITHVDIDGRRRAFDELVDSVQAIDVARGVIDEYVLQRAAEDLKNQFPGQPLVHAQIEEAIGAAYRALGMYTAADPYLRSALDTRRRELGDEHQLVSVSLNSLGLLLLGKGDSGSAEKLFREALALDRKLRGDTHETVADSLHNLAVTLTSMEQYVAAEPLLREAHAIRRQVFGESGVETIETWTDLLQALWKQRKSVVLIQETLMGLPGLSERLGQEDMQYVRDHAAIAIALASGQKCDVPDSLVSAVPRLLRKALGNDETRVAYTLAGLGGFLSEAGEYHAAEPLLREALSVHRVRLGNEHPTVAASLMSLALLLQSKGDHTAAVPLYREALTLNRKLYGDEHPNVADNLFSLATVLYSKGDHAAAEPLFRDVLSLWRKRGNDEHPAFCACLNNLGLCMQTKGDYIAAEPLLREALPLWRKLRGDVHSDTANAAFNLSVVLYKKGDYVAAEPFLREALAIRRKLLGDEHPGTLELVHSIGFLLQARGKLADAEPYYREALEKRRRVLGDEHRDTLGSTDRLGNVLKAQGKLDEAEPYYREVLENRRRVLGDEHLDTLKSISNMGSLRRAQGKPGEAELLYHQALAGYEKRLGAARWETANCQMGLGIAVRDLSRYAEAELHLLVAEPVLRTDQGVPPGRHRDCVQAIIKLYEQWHAAEPDQGYDAKAAEWRAKLGEWTASTQPADSSESPPASESEPPPYTPSDQPPE